MGVLANKGRKAKAVSARERAAQGTGRPRGRRLRVLLSIFPPLARLRLPLQKQPRL